MKEGGKTKCQSTTVRIGTIKVPMRDIIKKDKNMEKEGLFGMMALSMKAISKKVSSLVKAS